MAESTSVALGATPIPSSADISRAEKLVRERFVHDGEDPAVALASGSARRRALDAALAELDANPKAKQPSTAWRRENFDAQVAQITSPRQFTFSH